MSTLKTNNIEHVDASTPSVQMSIGGGVVFPGISTFTGNATFSANVSIGGTLTYEDVTSIDSVGIITAQSGIHLDDSITHLGDTNTKIRFPAADTVTVETAGSETARFTSSAITFKAPDGGSRYFFGEMGNSSSSELSLYDSSDAQKVRISSSNASFFNGGNFGIGTNNPSQELTVYGADPIISVQEASASSQVDIGTGTVTGFINIQKADGTRTIQINGNDDSYFTGGDFGIGTASPTARLDVRRGDADGKIAEFHQSSGYGFDIGSSQTEAYISSGYNQSFIIKTDPSSGQVERLRIASDGTSTFTGQRHKFIHNNSGGVGAYLSLFNTNATAGSSTGICFGIGGSDAVLDGTDYGESQIKVYSDSGNYGNMEINLHTGANRSYLKIVGNGQGETGASAGTEGMRGGVAFGNAGIAFDRSWTGQPGIHVFNENVEGDTDQANFRFHGWNKSYASYPGSSGSDFSVSLIADGMTLTSDRRRKTGITTITDALNTVSQMRGVSFTYVNRDLEPQTHMSMDNGKKLGFIAQEVIPLLPELILDSGEKAVELENGYCDRYNMDYGGVTPLLVEAIKELKAKNEVLEARIAALE